MNVRYTLLYILATVIMHQSHSFGNDLVINEIMPNNVSTLSDEDGDFPDWIELKNLSNTTINLSNYFITDNPLDTFKWKLPNKTLAPNNYFLIFASGKNRSSGNIQWETIIHMGDTLKYILGSDYPGANWKIPGFDDSNWSIGRSGIGYGDNDDNTPIPKGTISIYIRKKFFIENKKTIRYAVFHMDYDDAFVAYLNGREIARSNIGIVGTEPNPTETALVDHEAVIYQGGIPEMFPIDSLSYFNEGINVLAIQVHNISSNSSDLSAIPFLTIAVEDSIENPRGIDPHINVPNLYPHTNFRLNSDGESVYLYNSRGLCIDSVNYNYIPEDFSYGRSSTNINNWYLFDNPTPGNDNPETGYTAISSELQFSLPPGIYDNTISISITPLDKTNQTEIYYTTDGSMPTIESTKYTGPIEISKTTVIRARAIDSGKLPGNISTATYIVNFKTNLPIISLVTDPPNLWDWETGIYVEGPNADPAEPHFGANYWQDWEKPAYIEFFEPDKGYQFSANVGIKIYGAWTRANPQKSLAIFARKKYGTGKINYRLFPWLNIDEFESFVLRNSGNDWYYTMFRDGLVYCLVRDLNIDALAYRPAVLFLNGEYWGIHNIREKINEHYISSHHYLDKDKINLLEMYNTVIHGSGKDYNDLYNFIKHNNMTIKSNYEYVKGKMDIDEYINYLITEIYLDNRDWPGNNLKYWNAPGKKFRWILFDTDFCFGLYDPTAYKFNTLEFALEPNGPNWPNPPWSTLIFRKLIQNSSFRNQFINTACDLINTYLSYRYISETVDSLKNLISNEMYRHLERWLPEKKFYNWLNDIENIKKFAFYRPAYFFSFLQNLFGLSAAYSLKVHINPPEAGKIKINSIIINKPNFSGKYYREIPITIQAISKSGYIFDKWTGNLNCREPEMTIKSDTSTLEITANFKPAELPENAVVINEINYHSEDSFDPDDWVEIYNNTDYTIDISNWKLMDSNTSHVFLIPKNTILHKGDFIVIAKDLDKFRNLFPSVKNVIGETDFGFSAGGEVIKLFDDKWNLIDSVEYDDQSPWPVEPDGQGPTLELKDPDLDNSLPENWAASENHGTPGTYNSVFTAIDKTNSNNISEFKLLANYPNPFNIQTTIRFSIPGKGLVKLFIYDLTGKLIYEKVDEFKSAGNYYFKWNGKTTNGETLPSGVYLYRIEFREKARTGKMLFLK